MLMCLNFTKSGLYQITRFCGYFSVVLILYIKSANGEALKPGPAFSILASFSFMSLFIGFFIGNGITNLAEFKTTLGRTAQILTLEEKGDRVRKIDTETGRMWEEDAEEPRAQEGVLVEMEEMSLSWGGKLKGGKWEGTEGERVLEEVTAEVREGELVVVIGGVGSGKTSLLLGIAGESYVVGGAL